jgi:transposase-like protein
MTTKAELEEQVRAQAGELEALKAEIEQLQEAALTAEAQAAVAPDVPTVCINCGQRRQPITVDGQGYHCPVCHHTWTEADEQAPFRRGV